MNNIQTGGSALTAFRILYFAMLGGTVMLAAIIYFASIDSEPVAPELTGNILVIALFAAALALTISSFMWRRDLAKIQQPAEPLLAKFNAYRAASIKRFAFTEFATMFSVICYFLSKEPKLYIVVAILLVHFLTMFPLVSRIASQIGESPEDIGAL